MRQLLKTLPEIGFPHFPALCSDRRSQAGPPMAPQRHPDRFELVYIHSGMQFRATNGFNYPLSGGQALFIQADWPHGTGIMPRGTGHVFWLHIRSDLKKPLLNLPAIESQALITALKHVKPVLHLDQSIHQDFTSIFKLAKKDASTIDRIHIRQHLLHILISICNAPSSNPKPDPLLKIFEHSELLDQPALLAHKAGISLSRLRARCKELTGISLGDYLLQLRIQQAMQSLIHAQHKSITDIALDLGFSSSQYFATVFKRYTAMSPSAFRSDTSSPQAQRRLRKLGIHLD